MLGGVFVCLGVFDCLGFVCVFVYGFVSFFKNENGSGCLYQG